MTTGQALRGIGSRFGERASVRGEYPHVDRLDWILGHIPEGARVLELGCGTGWAITIPLLRQGVDVAGVDIDEASIEHGRALLRRKSLPEKRLIARDLREVDATFDVVILSEVIEHLHDTERVELLRLVRSKLSRHGTLLVTVPNGYTLFELEHWLWWKTGIGWLLTRTGIAPAIRRLRALLVSGETRSGEPSSLSTAPHVQRFTPRRITRRLEESGFRVTELRGSSLLGGPFSELCLRGSRTLENWNVAVAAPRPFIASGVYVACVPAGIEPAGQRRPGD